LLTFLVLASIYGWFTWQEQKRREEWERKRDELYRRHQERHGKEVEAKFDNPDESWPSVTRQDNSLLVAGVAVASPAIRLRFTTFDLLTVATLLPTSMVAASRWGLPGATLACGSLLLGGILWHTFGASPPAGLASGLWVLVVFYVALNLLTLLAG
jgi:hypothetical protein